jgi:hypothetical protein
MGHNLWMRNRRFLLLAATLVTLNTALWLVPQGFALPQIAVSTLFGKSMMRADVTENNGAEWRLDRGIVVTNVVGTLTLQEADSKVVPITTSSSTKVTAAGLPFKLKNIKPGWRVLVIYPGPNGTAVSVTVERRSKPASLGSG